MLQNYLSEILIMILNVIDSLKKFLYAIITNTLHKIKTTSRIKFAETCHFEV